MTRNHLLRRPRTRNHCLPAIVLTLIALVLPLRASQIITNWVAYNDHRPGPLPTSNTWGTARNVTAYDMRVGPGGNLTNFLNGQQLPVLMSVTPNGVPDDFGTCVYPYANTPASNIFFGIVDVANQGSVIGVRYSADTYVTLTFNNLDPAKHYLLRGTSVRGGSYPLRWTVATITGADTFIDAHTSGVITSNNYPAALEPGQAAYNSGDNRRGDVVGWDFINPGEDGSFSIISSNYVGPIPSGGNAAIDSYGYAISSLLLAEVEVSPPAIVRQPPAETTVEQNRSFNLTVTASGTPLLYQWYREGVGQIPGATFASYAVPRSALADSGDYYVVVYNPLASVTSTLAHVTVIADTNPPSIGTAFCYPSFDPATQVATIDQVIVEFSEAVETTTATDTSNYLLSDGNTPALVTLTNDRTVILKLSAPLAEDTDYTIQVNSVRDLVDNSISASNNPASFRTWMLGLANGVSFEVYDTGPGGTVDLLTNSPLFPDHPSFRTNLYAFDSRVAYPDDTHNAYGSRIRGVFIPPVSGDWVFFLRTDERGTVYLNPNGMAVSGKQPLLAETTGNNPRDWNKLISDPVPLRAGQAYYLEALHKEDTGADFTKVAARLAGTGLPTLSVPDTEVDTNALTGAAIAYPLAPRDLGGPLTLVRDVADLTAQEFHPVTFAVEVTNPSGLPVYYQWRRDGSDIPGANGQSYTLIPTNADNGAVFSVQVAKLGSFLASSDARLTVVPDTNPPTVVRVRALYSQNQVIVSFSEMVDPSTATDAVNYQFTGGIAVASVPVLDSTGTNVTLTLDAPLTPGAVYSITIASVLDVSTRNQLDSMTLPLYAWVMSRGFALEQLYFNLGTGTSVSDLTNSAKYPNSPDVVTYANTLEGPIDSYDEYGTRLAGWLQAPVSGDFVFYMCSDDNGDFLLSPDNNPQNATLIAREPSWSAARTWTGPGSNNDRGDPPANVYTNTLVAGELYAFELLAKDGTGGDNAGVAWQLPGDTPPADGTPGIPGAYLYSLADPVGANVTITQQPANLVLGSLPATATLAVGASSTYQGAPNTLLSYLWQRDTGAGFQDILGAYNRTNQVTIPIGATTLSFRCLVFSPGASATSAVATVLSQTLAVRMDADAVRVSWPATLTNLVLDQTATLSGTPPPWTLVPTGTYQTDATSKYILVSPPTGTMFYRLRQQ